jgi:hypothetical protein
VAVITATSNEIRIPNVNLLEKADFSHLIKPLYGIITDLFFLSA